MVKDWHLFDSADQHQGEDLVVRVRKNGALRFANYAAAAPVIKAARDQGLTFGFIVHGTWGTLVVDRN